MKSVRRLLTSAALAAALPLSITGCLFVAGAAIGAGIVHTTGEDTAEVVVEANSASAYAAAREEIQNRGVVESADADSSRVQGTVGGSSVTVSVSSPSSGEARVSVSARKNGGISPDIDTAEQVAMSIVKRTR